MSASAPIQYRSHPGFTLIEVVTTLTLGSLMAMLAVGLVHRAFLAHQRSQTRVECCQRWDELASQFRRDVWSSERAELSDEQKLILFVDPLYSDSQGVARIEYSIRENQLTRLAVRKESLASARAEQLHRESYPLLDGDFGTESTQQSLGDSEHRKAVFQKSGSKIILQLHQPIATLETHAEAVAASPKRKRTFEATLGKWIANAPQEPVVKERE